MRKEVAKDASGLLGALPLLDQFGGHVLDAEPDGADSGLTGQWHQVGGTIDIVLGPFGADPDGVTERPATHRAACHRREDLLGGLVVVEEVVVGAEEAVDARELDHRADLVDEPLRAAKPERALVIGVDRAIGAVEPATVGHVDRQHPRELSQAIRGHRRGVKRGPVMRPLEQTQGRHWQGKLVEVLNQTLNARVDQLIDRAGALGAAVDQAGDVFQATGGARRVKAWRMVSPSALKLEQPVEQGEEDELLTRDHHVSASVGVDPDTEEVPGFVDGLGPSRQDQGAVLAQRPGVVDQPVGRGAMDLHARNQKQLGRLAAEPGLAGPDVGRPLLEHDPDVGEPRRRNRRGNGNRCRGRGACPRR